jgi:putative transferase (TIGR04331 family)
MKSKSLSDLMDKIHPWENSNYYHLKFKFLKKKHKKFLKIFRSILNRHHNVKFSEKYWEILLSNYIFQILYIYYERKECITSFKRSKSFKLINNTPKIGSYEDLRMNFEFFHEYIHAKIIEHYFPHKKKIYFEKFFKLNKEFKKSKSVNFILNYFFEKILNIIFSFKQNTKVCNVGSKSLISKIKLYSVFKKFKVNLSMNYKLDSDARQKLLNYKNLKDEHKLIFSLMINLLPMNYLENFKVLSNSIKKNYSITKLLYVEYFTDPLRFLAAQIKENNGKLLIAQHGGNYWAFKEHFSREFETKIADYYFPWGKKSSKRISIFGYSKKKYNLKKNVDHKCIIFLPKLLDFHRSLDSNTIFKPKKLLKDNLFLFYKNLNYQIKKNSFFKMHVTEKKYRDLLKQKFGNKLIKFDPGENFFSKDFKLSIHTYFGSSFLESMISNIPTILIIQNFDANDKFTVSQLKILKKYQIVFTSSKKASFFINKNWKQINGWWNSNLVKSTREKFLKNYAFHNNNFTNEILNLVSRIN